MLSSSQIKWDCPNCQITITDHHKYYNNCQSMLIWTCVASEKSVYVSKCYPSSVHDITILRESGLLEHTEEHVQIIADKGYIGEQYVVTPKKKSCRGELTAEDKDFNRFISSARAAIENINQRIKTYAILGSIYKGPYDDLDKITKIVRVVVALCNLKLISSLLPKSSESSTTPAPSISSESLIASVALSTSTISFATHRAAQARMRKNCRLRKNRLLGNHREIIEEIVSMIRHTLGRPNIEDSQSELLSAIVDIANRDLVAVDNRRCTDTIQSCLTLDSLKEQLDIKGYRLSRTATYYRNLLDGSSKTIDHTLELQNFQRA
ncbi:unnamed protein product [Rotaria sordida]|uniref:DDE Tnp4 domain-containing protein n=1 Tax=Rotaria sordida TaxID=392033 RepID=A0A814S6F7_9BILA|nr:unnamed protein product [Rotaria sordida]CAF1141984.1 unnamed protein product [Rotaria sordida]CAF3979435.1 unnamed protein product [Rotaria sordida]CAF4053332.1 unnamed protein product [Rotaria sordida]